MPWADVSLVLTADEPAARRAGDALFPAVERHFLSRHDLRPAAPFEGRLFTVLSERPAGSRVGLVVPVAWHGEAASGDASAPGVLPPGTLLAVADHLNLELRGPLTGRWPACLPRSFPPLTGIYQPADVRARGGARVYSAGVVVAGVADAGRLTPFEAGALSEAGHFVVSDSLVPSAIVAAYYGLTLAACGVPRVDDNDEQ
jgi:hypothetical protein